MFGFTVREERRWGVESDAIHFRPGEYILWTMRLENIDRDATSAVAHFRLTREERAFSGRQNILNPDEMDYRVTETHLWVNENGFPLRVWYNDDRAGSLSGGGHVEVRWREGHLRVSNPDAMGFRDYDLRVPGGDDIDAQRPSGVFLSSTVNPGLLALPFAMALERPDRSIRFVAFDPTPLLADEPGNNASRGPHEPANPRQLSDRSLQWTTLTIGMQQALPVGGVTTFVHHVDLSSSGDVFIEPGGNVVRVNIMMRRANAWIRALRPSEF